MGENSKIEWTDHTFNPWIGCQYWKLPLKWAKEAGAEQQIAAMHDKVLARRRVFCASLADVFDNQVPGEWRSDLFDLIAGTPELDWLLLTKRPENLRRMFPRGYWKNVWLGVTCEDHAHYNRRWPLLAEITRIPVRFVSYEPALGPLFPPGVTWNAFPDWIICGGETGSRAREMDPAWARTLLDACKVLNIKFFMKQMTHKRPIPQDLMVREFPHQTSAKVI
jgi:protein gp37